ncbi:ABC transporter ATP-binding protein [Rhodococcus triatomae]|uniref:ATP-binding cassette, subfamily B n=1 Tax=Rhodococcus triatomae TaxID=300028 RepID=A0A1G8LYY7_9NOCA|nr:ABC transporter ATP-binding protein [Rhodococcus triatomae]QNG18240.1 ABC transporter ATP-binding protein [Rhodococcus triatomae]QNG22089.1 ABC transporter ATP-binding protein [Rhodococcus triatomae]SDI60924.1 ATP-binding cassette, subfamily B [Rhodococcus triatomae]
MTTDTAVADEASAEQEPDSLQQQNPGGKPLKALLRPVAPKLAIGRILAVISALLAVVPYIALVHIGDMLLRAVAAGEPVDGDEVQRWLRILVITFTLRLLVYFVALTITHVADIQLGHVIRQRMVERFARVPLVWFTSTNSGRVRKALQDDIGTVHNLIAHQPVDGTNAAVMPLALMVYAFVVDWRLGLLTVATIPLYVAATAFSMRGMGAKTAEMDQRLSTVSARMVEFVTGITVVKAFGRVGRAHRRYQDAAEEFQQFYYSWVGPLIRVSSLGSSLLAVPLILLINIGGGTWLVHRDLVTPANVLATSLIALLVPYGIEVLMNSMWAQQMAVASAQRIVDLLDTPVLDDRAGDTLPVGHEVVFDRVSYSYGSGDDAELALDEVGFTLREGTVTALVGPSGSGKSTIATLLARFDDPRSGQIRLGGVPVAAIGDLYSHVGFVLQDPQLPAISIRDNIALGRPDATDEQIREAARAAQILDEIDSLPRGFDTVYGSDTGLSGGQAQRIAIARAILVDAPVLVLDEATALTDPESQHQIQQALSRLVRGRTVLVIGHRPEVISGVDQIVLVESGRVVATGTHDDLLEEPAYARLWRFADATSSAGAEGGL